METIYENDFDVLVLAGSSAKGIAVLGALQNCYDKNMLHNVQCYMGTSSGFIINYLLIIGYTPVEILVNIFTNNILENMQQINFNNLLKGNGGLNWENSVGNVIRTLTLEKIKFIPTFEDLLNKFNKKLIGVTYNASFDKLELLSVETTPNLTCIEAAKMTSNLPFLFEKCKYNNSYYLDGGIVNNFPIDLAKNVGTNILGIVTYNQLKKDKEINNKIIENENQLEFIYKLMFITIDQSTESKIVNCVDDNLRIIKIPIGSLKSYNFNINSKEKFSLFSKGYTECKTQLID
jgi:predicted acylesterase/phospholipase RssA